MQLCLTFMFTNDFLSLLTGKNAEFLPLTLETLIRQPGIKQAYIAVIRSFYILFHFYLCSIILCGS